MRLSENVPRDIIEAYMELSHLRRKRGEVYPPIPLTKCIEETKPKINKESNCLISKKCFEFIKRCIMKQRGRVVNVTTAFGGMFSRDYRENSQCTQCCIFLQSNEDPPCTSTSIQSLWKMLVRTIHSMVKGSNAKRKAREC